VFENGLPNQSTAELGNIMGKISPPFLHNHYPSVAQKEAFKFETNLTTQSLIPSGSNGMTFMQTQG
jgi:hypothetical protein